MTNSFKRFVNRDIVISNTSLHENVRDQGITCMISTSMMDAWI